MSKLARRHRRRKFKRNPSSSAFRRNPPITRDLIEWVAPGFAGFAASRLLTRVVQSFVSARFPKAGKHAGAIASLSSFLASWFLGHKVAIVAKYHTPITVGAAIAAGQSLLQIYAPNKLGWIVSDAAPAIASAKIAAPVVQQALPDHMEEINDDPGWYTYKGAGKDDYGTLSKSTSWTPQIDAGEQVDAAIDQMQPGDEEAAAGIFG